MSCWTKEELEHMLEDVINELELSDGMLEKHGPMGTAPAELVRIILDSKDLEIAKLKHGIISLNNTPEIIAGTTEALDNLTLFK